jgi:hypothetical protein
VKRGASHEKYELGTTDPSATPLPTLPGARHRAAADALRRLLEFDAPKDAPSSAILEKVTALHDRVSEVAKLAAIDGLNKTLVAAAGEPKERRSSTVLAVVRFAADQGLDFAALDVTRDEVADALQVKLDSITGTRPGSFDANSEIIALIRPALAAYELRLVFQEHVVTVRPTTNRKASIQVRLPGVERETLLTTTEWPAFTVSKAR